MGAPHVPPSLASARARERSWFAGAGTGQTSRAAQQAPPTSQYARSPTSSPACWSPGPACCSPPRTAPCRAAFQAWARTHGPVVRDVTNETNEAGKGDATCADRHGASGLRCLPARAALRRVACRRLRRLRGGYYAAVWGGMFVRAFGETAPCRGAGARVRSHG